MDSFSHFKSTENEKIIFKSSWRINYQEMCLIYINICGGYDKVRLFAKTYFIPKKLEFQEVSRWMILESQACRGWTAMLY